MDAGQNRATSITGSPDILPGGPEKIQVSAVVIIFDPHDVVFIKAFAKLDFDKNQSLLAGVLYPVLGLAWNVDVTARLDRDLIASDCHLPLPADHNPMFASVMMILQRQALPGFDFDGFDGEGWPCFQHGPTPPWPCITVAGGIAGFTQQKTPQLFTHKPCLTCIELNANRLALAEGISGDARDHE